MADGTVGYADGLGRRDVPADFLPGFPAAWKRISWGAVFAGLIVSIMVSLVLGLLGMGIGLGAMNPMEEANPFAGLGMGAAIWWVVSSLIALFAGGWVAARMAGFPKRADGAVHGILVWGLVTLVTFYFLSTTIGKLVGGVSGMLGQGLSVAGKGASAVAPDLADRIQDELRQQGMTMQSIQREADDLLRQAMGGRGSQSGQTVKGAVAAAAQDPQQASREIRQALDRLMSRGQGAASQADRSTVVNTIASRTGLTPEQAGQIVDRWMATYQQAKDRAAQAKATAEQKARERGDTAAAGMSKASLWTFVALLLGGFAAALGGRFGIPRQAPTLAAQIK